MNNLQVSASIVICTLNRPDDIQRCIRTVCRQTQLPRQVIIVDAGNLGSVREQLADTCAQSGIEFIYRQAEPSTTRQRNEGAALVDADVTFFLDDDVELREDYLERILSVYQIDRAGEVGGACGVLKPAPEPGSGFWHWYARVFLLAETRTDVAAYMKASNYPVHSTMLTGPRDSELMPSTAVSYRTAIFREFLFDTHLSGYVMAEDLDLSYRVSRRYRLRVLPGAVYRHRKSPVSRNDRRETEKRRLLFTQYFFRKNLADRATCWLARYWALLGLGLRYSFVAVRSGDRQWLQGYVAGLRAAARNRILWPGRFEPGPLEH